MIFYAQFLTNMNAIPIFHFQSTHQAGNSNFCPLRTLVTYIYAKSAYSAVYDQHMQNNLETGERYLNKSSNHGNGIQIIISKVSINPIWNVQRAIGAECKEVMRCDVFSFSCSLYDEQLRQYCYTFEPNAKRPKNLLIRKVSRIRCRRKQTSGTE